MSERPDTRTAPDHSTTPTTVTSTDASSGPAAGAARRRPARGWRRAAVRVVAGAALATAAGVAGVATSAAWPTEATTRQYSATVRLATDPTRAATIHSPTVFGDLDLRFGGLVPAPGIDATLQVRDSIASVLATSGLDMRSLRPTTAELDAAATSAAWQVGLKVLAGVLVVTAVGWLVLRATPVGGATPVVAGLLALGVVGASLAATYRPGDFRAVETSGLLSLVRANAGVLGDVEKRSAEATPYVRNMLALTAALQDRYAPTDIATDTAVKIVAVSDIHGQNQYPLLKSLVEQEKATAVIDSGDLVNFGSVREAEAAGLFSGIASLGVPYLFVRGNHDAHTPTDDALVQRLRRIPNVVVLEPAREREYTLAQVGGLAVAGFGDPRWFGDGGRNTVQAQGPAVAAFTAAMKGLADGSAPTTVPADLAKRPLDMLVGHEPSAVEPLASLARVRLNGHLHAQSLEGSRIALGSFTGGGVVSHYIAADDGSELAGQPYAFDVLAFSSSCSLASLTRYRFTNLLEGRPTYDNVQVLNGASIEQEAPTGRTCSADDPLRTYSVRVPAGAATSTATPGATPSVTASLPSDRPTPTATKTPATN